mmetsp:Transcript_16875/g.27348  ORF Transcript_16875/g.27348 Transcript_16875/m.27348 type:complete len:472 (+) Transcript_16875:469-1884(+)|eukprot:CAMPEP_0203772322 /NCGR_PEP_ID=MMETSP0099_2-20121227/3963_1 /ASSEMBLY_ACC=CAM_ASM_000209 /TAXON_ID=96639 /ORGANISM=" , Strain NY0313808BC1" /LENGTH=471 /DNA_ID=CAMNT_0050669879 /DNA_START=382 /DNA_END=1797 /DNA_ORIENTATION=-
MLTDNGFERLKKLMRKVTKASKEDTLRDLRTIHDPDNEHVNNIKKLVKGGGRSSGILVWELVSCLLQSKNSKIRYMTLILINMIVVRSKSFRRSVFEDLKVLIEAVIQIPGLSTLPPPERAKALLHKTGLRLVESWHAKYKSEYPTLGLTSRFLKAKFENQVDTELFTNRREQEQKQREDRTRRLLRAQFETVCNEMGTMESFVRRINDNIVQMEESASLLSSQMDAFGAIQEEIELQQRVDTEEDDDDDFDINWSSVQAPSSRGTVENDEEVDDDVAEWEAFERENERQEKADKSDVRKQAVMKLVSSFPANYNLRIDLDKSALLKSDTSEPVLNALREACVEAKQAHLPLVHRWVKVLSEVELEDRSSFHHRRSLLLAQALELKQKLVAGLERAKHFNVVVENVPRISRQTEYVSVLLGTAAPVQVSASSSVSQPLESSKSEKKKKKKRKKEEKKMSRKRRKPVGDPFK